jgi:RNA polymerase sigma-70 factor, ECF subfamily
MITDERTDEELVAATLHDKEAFVYIMERYEPRLRRYVRRITNRAESDIDDLLQETFIKAYRYLNSFDASFSFSSWMYRIARTVVISDHRKRTVRPEYTQVIDDELSATLAGDDDDPETVAILRENSAQVRTVLATLKDEYREVLILRYFEGKSYTEMSDIMMKPEGTIATLLNRGKRALRQALNLHRV